MLMNKSQDEIDREAAKEHVRNQWGEHGLVPATALNNAFLAALTYERNRKSEEVEKSFEDAEVGKRFKEETGSYWNEYPWTFAKYCYTAGAQAEKERVR
jgi:hypothetical protein